MVTVSAVHLRPGRGAEWLAYYEKNQKFQKLLSEFFSILYFLNIRLSLNTAKNNYLCNIIGKDLLLLG